MFVGGSVKHMWRRVGLHANEVYYRPRLQVQIAVMTGVVFMRRAEQNLGCTRVKLYGLIILRYCPDGSGESSKFGVATGPLFIHSVYPVRSSFGLKRMGLECPLLRRSTPASRSAGEDESRKSLRHVKGIGTDRILSSYLFVRVEAPDVVRSAYMRQLAYYLQ